MACLRGGGGGEREAESQAIADQRHARRTFLFVVGVERGTRRVEDVPGDVGGGVSEVLGE